MNPISLYILLSAFKSPKLPSVSSSDATNRTLIRWSDKLYHILTELSGSKDKSVLIDITTTVIQFFTDNPIIAAEIAKKKINLFLTNLMLQKQLTLSVTCD